MIFSSPSRQIDEQYLSTGHSHSFFRSFPKFLVKVSSSILRYLEHVIEKGRIPVAGPSKAWVCGRSLAGIAGSNPTEGMDVSLL
jgi:hypothetical protein